MANVRSIGAPTGAGSADKSATMRVEITEDKLSDNDPVSGQHFALGKGDTITVPESVGKRWCAYGWAKDKSGKFATGERIAGTREVIADDVNLSPEK